MFFMKSKSLFFCLTFGFIQLLSAQNAIVGSGFTTGWGSGSCAGMTNSNFEYLGSGAGGSFIRTEVANATGDQYFRLGVDWSGQVRQHTISSDGSNSQVNPNTEYTLNSTCTTSGAMFMNVASTSHNFIFKTFDAGTTPQYKMIYFLVQGAVQTVASVAQSPLASDVHAGQSVTVTATLSGAFSTGQSAYLAYSSDNFSSRTIVEASGSGTTYTATIPALVNTLGTTVKYYLFTSGPGLAGNMDNTTADWYTINLNNNSGSNYQYTVLAALPISLIDFVVHKTTNDVELKWIVSEQSQNRAFQIERSPDAQNWETLDQLAGAGTSFEEKNYSWIDRQPLEGTSFYRLRQIDYDGQFSLSPVRKVERTGGIVFTVFPNPTVSSTTVKTISATEGEALIDLIDATGRYVGTANFLLQKGENLLEMPLGGMPGGWYTLVYSAANGKFSQRIFIKSE